MSYKTILVPLDGSEFSTGAVEEAARLGRPHGSQLVLLAVVETQTAQFEGYAEFVSGMDIRERIRAQLEELLAKTAAELEKEGFKVKTLVRDGFPHEEIIAVCEEERADVIVMTTHGRRGFIHWLMGSVAEKVVRSAPCSVLVVRSPEASEGD